MRIIFDNPNYSIQIYFYHKNTNIMLVLCKNRLFLFDSDTSFDISKNKEFQSLIIDMPYRIQQAIKIAIDNYLYKNNIDKVVYNLQDSVKIEIDLKLYDGIITSISLPDSIVTYKTYTVTLNDGSIIKCFNKDLTK